MAGTDDRDDVIKLKFARDSEAGAVDRRIGERIRALRLAEGVTLSELALAVGVSAQQLQRYESGAARISASRLVIIARLLRRPVSTLLDLAALSAGHGVAHFSTEELLAITRDLSVIPPELRVHVRHAIAALAERLREGRRPRLNS